VAESILARRRGRFYRSFAFLGTSAQEIPALSRSFGQAAKETLVTNVAETDAHNRAQKRRHGVIALQAKDLRMSPE
jgi:hypothetical protein